MKPDIIYKVSQSQFSIAKFSGGIRLNGIYYHYNPIEDTLTRADILRQKKAINRCLSINEQLQIEKACNQER